MRPLVIPHPVKTLLSFCCLTTISLFSYANPVDSTFKDWYFTPGGVYGRTPVAEVRYRNYVTIDRLDANTFSVRKFNPAGRLVDNFKLRFTAGKISLITETNEWGEAVDSMWFTPDGKDEFIVREERKGENPYRPCKAVRYTYKNDLLHEILCLADSTKPGMNQEGVAHYIFDRYDDPIRFGMLKSESFFNEIDMPVFSRKEGCHRLDYEYDKKENLINRRAYNEKDKPMSDRNGAFRTTYKYDGDDNQTEVDYYDANGTLVINDLGYATMAREFKRGFPETETFYDNNYHAIISSSLADSVSTTLYRYDKAGRLTEKMYFHPDGGRMNDKNGICRETFEYSEAGMLTGETHYGLDVRYKQEHELVTFRFGHDEKGRLTSLVSFLSISRPLAKLANGAQSTKYGYDIWGRVSSTSYWLEDSFKTRGPEGYHESRNRYDANGQVLEQDYYDEAGKLLPNPEGFSRILLTYNEQGLVSGRRYFDGDRPVSLKRSASFYCNFHEVRYAYDLLNRLRSIEYFDTARRPVNAILANDSGKIFQGQRIDISYAGGRMTSQELHASGDVSPSKSLDCWANQCIPVPGYPTSHHIYVATHDQPNYHGKFKIDSLFGRQMAFITSDSVLLFLGAGAVSLSPQACAERYRVVRINRYYQEEGLAIDRYLQNDSIAARLSYTEASLDGPCSFYYMNGKVKEMGEYRKNARTGIWKYYYDNGQLEKVIDFTGKIPLLVECYGADGKPLAQQGNGRFEGNITTGTARNQAQYMVTGTVRNGLPDGEWKVYNRFISGPANIETFSAGAFKHGVSFSLFGKTEYRQNPIARFESIHPEESLDYYGQNNVCFAEGMPWEHFAKDWYTEIKSGFNEIMRTNQFKDFSSWIFMDIKFDEDGRITNQYVRLGQPNDAFRTAILNMTDRLENNAIVTVKNAKTAYEKFFVILVGGGEVVIPEQILSQQRSMIR